jgi:predicted RNase H-like HicB family nuclease
MKNIIYFKVNKGMDGYYVASAMDFPIITQAKDLDELVSNAKEASELYFEECLEDEEADSFSKTPSLLINFEVPLFRAYA